LDAPPPIDGSGTGPPSPARRVLALLDPAEPGFLRRMALLAAVAALAGCCAVAALAGRAARTPVGRYWTSVVLLEAGRLERSERIARELVADPTVRGYGHYRVLAAALRRQGKVREQLSVYDDAIVAYPTLEIAHGHRCWYYALFDNPEHVMDSCDAAVALAAPSKAGKAHFWRAAARAMAGDGTGAIEDLNAAREAWAAGAEAAPAYRATAARWLATLQAGGAILDAAEIEELRDWF